MIAKIEYRCTGATLSNEQPGTFAGLIAAAHSYAQKNQGDKFQAILWPFSALDSYNRAEEQYSGQRMPWSQQAKAPEPSVSPRKALRLCKPLHETIVRYCTGRGRLTSNSYLRQHLLLVLQCSQDRA